jgi:FSR family fosmidomycin resistance protein-like MFS transporter
LNIPLNIPRKRVFWAVALGHFITDTFMSIGPVLLAFLSVSILPLTNTQIGLMIGATQLMGAISQPGFGLLADRSGGRWLGAGGVAWTVGLFMVTLVGAQTGYFWLVFFPFVFRAIGSGAFHPAGSMHAANSDRDRSASTMAYFFLMGQLGLAIGPFLVGQLLDLANPNSQSLFLTPFGAIYDGAYVWWGTITPIFFLALPAIPVVVFMALSLPNAARYRAENSREAVAQDTPAKNGSALPVRIFVLFALMVALRSLAQPGSVAFFPVLFQDKGWSPTEYGAITSAFWIASAIAGVVFGNIADRVDRRLVITGGLLLSAPAFFVLPIVDGGLAFVMAIAAGGLTGGSHSIIVVLAQDLLPQSKALASGSILGFIFATGALGTLLIGALSDWIGLNATFQIVAAVIALAGVLALALPARRTAIATSG